MSRPSDFTQDIADRICAEIAEGKSLRKVCEAEDLPHRSTVHRWLKEIEAFRDQYARAMDDRADKLADEILEISDDDSGDFGFKKVQTADGESAEPFIDKDNIQRARLRVDSRKWLAGKLAPKKYGDKVLNEHTGEGGGPIAFAVEVNFIKPKAHGTDGQG